MYCIWLNQQLAQTGLSSDSQVCKLDEASGIPKEPTLSFFKGKIMINPLDKDPKANLGENIKPMPLSYIKYSSSLQKVTLE
jgi:hypothetical protein